MSGSSESGGGGGGRGGAKLETANRLLQQYAAKFPRVGVAGPAQIKALQDRGEALVVDVRTDAERAVSVIPGSISKAEFEALPAGELAGKTIVPYCTMGYRSGEYATKLLDVQAGKAKAPGGGDLAAGLAQARGVLNGSGVVLWTHDAAVDALVDPATKQPAKEVHVFGKTWDLAADGYKTRTFQHPWWQVVKSKIGVIFSISAGVLAVSLLVVKLRGSAI